MTSNEINIKEFKKINLEGGYLIDGFPSVGFSSAIATESMIHTSQFELGGVIDSETFPPISVIKNGKPNYPSRIFVNEDLKMKDALKVLNSKKLGFILVRDKKNLTRGIITDGELRRFSQKKQNLHNLFVKQIMTKNPIGIDKSELAAKALSVMNSEKITSLCVFNKKNKSKTIGVLHIHNILQSNIS